MRVLPMLQKWLNKLMGYYLPDDPEQKLEVPVNGSINKTQICFVDTVVKSHCEWTRCRHDP